MHEVTVDEPGFCTPRMVMQRCLLGSLLVVCEARTGGRDPRSLHDHSDTARLDRFLDGDGDLLREPLLHLQTSAERLCYPCKLGDAQNELVRDVCYRNLRLLEVWEMW